MKIIITDRNNEAHDVALRLWRGGWNAGFEPDCLEDLDGYLVSKRDRHGVVHISDKEFVDVVDWWRSEIANPNSGKDGEVLNALTEDEIERGDEWMLIVD